MTAFLMTLDSSVMNVAIATVAKDVGTTVTGIHSAITLYTRVMAMLMVTGREDRFTDRAAARSASAA
jgi:glutaminase